MPAATDKKICTDFVPLTAAQAKERLRMQGITITAFAKAHSLGRDTVSDLLNERANGTYGESHRAAVALGMKATPETPAKSRADKAQA